MSDQGFSRWWPFSSSSADKTPSPSLHMFIEDVQTWIMPYDPDSSSSELGAVFDGNEQDARVVTRICADLAEHSSIHDSPLELVSSAVRRVSQHLVWRGSVAFELPDLRDPSDEETLSDPRRSVRPITGELLFRLPGRVVGIRTAQRREWEQALPVVVNRLAKSVWHVSMPRTLGGRIGYRSVRRRLDRYSSIMPAWASRSMATEHERVRFDVTAYARLRHAYVERSSGPFSWDGRNTSLDHQTEFFLFYRTLTFHHALALLRQHIVASLNRLFERQLGLNARIVLTGFRQPADILDIRGRMERGEISFGEAFDQVKF